MTSDNLGIQHALQLYL